MLTFIKDEQIEGGSKAIEEVQKILKANEEEEELNRLTGMVLRKLTTLSRESALSVKVREDVEKIWKIT